MKKSIILIVCILLIQVSLNVCAYGLLPTDITDKIYYIVYEKTSGEIVCNASSTSMEIVEISGNLYIFVSPQRVQYTYIDNVWTDRNENLVSGLNIAVSSIADLIECSTNILYNGETYYNETGEIEQDRNINYDFQYWPCEPWKEYSDLSMNDYTNNYDSYNNQFMPIHFSYENFESDVLTVLFIADADYPIGYDNNPETGLPQFSDEMIQQKWELDISDISEIHSGMIYIDGDNIMYNNGYWGEGAEGVQMVLHGNNEVQVYDGIYDSQGSYDDTGINHVNDLVSWTAFNMQYSDVWVSSNYTDSENYGMDLLVKTLNIDDTVFNMNGLDFFMPDSDNALYYYNNLPFVNGTNTITIKGHQGQVYYSKTFSVNNSSLPTDVSAYNPANLGYYFNPAGDAMSGTTIQDRLDAFGNAIMGHTSSIEGVKTSVGAMAIEVASMAGAMNGIGEGIEGIQGALGVVNENLVNSNTKLDLINTNLGEISEKLNGLSGDGSTDSEVTAAGNEIVNKLQSKIPVNVLGTAWGRIESMSIQEYHEYRPEITVNLKSLFDASVEYISPESMQFNTFEDIETPVIDFLILEQIQFMGMAVIDWFRMLIGMGLILSTAMYFYRTIIPSKVMGG